MGNRNTNRYLDLGDGVTHLVLQDGTTYVIDTTDRPLIEGYTWRRSGKKYMYACTNVKKGNRLGTLKLHRILCQTTAERPFVDHESGDVLDNRRSNLRPCTRAENNANKGRYKNNKTTVKGVFFHKSRQKFEAWVGVGGKQLYVGCYTDPSDAEQDIRAFRERQHGEFARHA